MKGSKDSYIRFARLGKKVYTKEVYANMNINFFGRSKELTIHHKIEY